jgi:hypothetical protein
MALPAAAEAAALADAEALAEAEALADAEEALPLPEEQPARTAAMPAAAPTPMKPLLVKFFIMHSFPFPCGYGESSSLLPFWHAPPLPRNPARISTHYSDCYTLLK